MLLSELRGKKVRSLDGETLGRVHEVHCDGGRVTALMCGAASFIERWTAREQGRRVPWELVKRIERDAIIISDEKPSAARSRPGTRRANAPRSKR
jgi:sporulation protein YlmC with PRC-barrel domain